MPKPVPVVAWSRVVDDLHFGTHKRSVLICVKRVNVAWEWTIRGSKGGDAWTVAVDLNAAKIAATQAL